MMKRSHQLIVALGIILVGAVLVPFVAFPSDRIEWQAFTNVYEPQADLVLTKTDSVDPLAVGQPISYLLTVENQGPESAVDIELQDTLPGNVILDSVEPSKGNCIGSTIITCGLGTLFQNEKATVTITGQAIGAGTMENHAWVSSASIDPNPNNNTVFEATSIIEGTSDVIEPGTSTTLVYSEPGKPETVIEVPPGAVGSPMTMAYVPRPGPAEDLPSNLMFAGAAFNLGVYDDGVSLGNYVFDVPIGVAVSYDSDSLGGVNEESLLLYYWNGSEWVDAATTCDPRSVYNRNPAEHWLSLDLCHLTEYALVERQPRVFLPVVLKNY